MPFGFHFVLLVWCNGFWRIPVGFRLWLPRRSGEEPYRTKLELAQDLVRSVLRSVLRAGLSFEYLVFELWYNARWFTKWLDKQGITWVSTLKSNALVTYRGRTQPVGVLARGLPRHRIADRTWAWVGSFTSLRRHLPRYGIVCLVVVTNGQGGLDHIVSNDLHRRARAVIRRKRSRWDVETCFRDTKQLACLKACQRRVPQAMERHIAMVLLTFVLLYYCGCSDLTHHKPLREVKRHLQIEAIKGGFPSPTASAGTSTRAELMAVA